MVSLFKSGTEYVANEITMLRGATSDILSVGVYHTTNPLEIPDVVDFVTVQLVEEPDPLAEVGKIDILSLVGPRDGDVNLSVAGDYQRWILIVTATEDIIRRVDVIEVS